jgi:geranylgeranyl diphosphate synthase, type II
LPDENFYRQLQYFKDITTKEIDLLLKKRNYKSNLLYNILPEYPSRGGKSIRPALCFATCLAIGGNETDAMNSATAIELFHNAFLIKDDIEDDSQYRRKESTLKEKYGISIAINIGDALAVLAINLLLENVDTVGVSKTLRIFEEIKNMAKFTVEGQAMELEWIRKNEWSLNNYDYYSMCKRKTAWYTAAIPCRVGLIAGARSSVSLDRLRVITKFGLNLGLSFQIQDDILNLTANDEYGKEINGDILEGKRTLILIKLFEYANNFEKNKIKSINRKKRIKKNTDDVEYIRSLIDKYNCIEECSIISKRYAKKSIEVLDHDCNWLIDKRMKKFLRQMAEFTVERHI